jgi:anaerobic magnesium-protoporphyrin IX monomethyl ester cyclase
LAPLLAAESIVYRCFGRVDQCSPEVTGLLYQSGCRHIAFGVESGAPSILQHMGKQQTVDDIRRGIANAHASGLQVRVYLIAGFPGETWDTIRETVNLMLECAPDEFSIYPLVPYPGTPLYSHPAEYGIAAIDRDFAGYFQVRRDRGTGYVFRTAGLDQVLIAEMRQYVIDRLEPTIRWAGNSILYR